MTNYQIKYHETLAAFAKPGARWENIVKLVYWGKANGSTADQIISDAHTCEVFDRDSDIRRCWDFVSNRDYRPQREATRSHWAKSSMVQSKIKPNRVTHLIEAGKDISGIDALRELSIAEIYPGTSETARRIQTETHLQLLFSRSDIVSMRYNKNDKSPAKPGQNLQTMGKWLFSTDKCGELVRPNPMTGKPFTRNSGKVNAKTSYGFKECIAAFRFMIWEFDELSLADQCRFWAGVIRRGKLPLVSLTFSGGKSIHGVIRVDAPNAETWERCRAATIERYAAASDKHYRLDVQALSPLTGTRLAGIVRKDTGKVQELLFDCGKIMT